MVRKHTCAALVGMFVFSLALPPVIKAAEADTKKPAPKASSEEEIRHALASKTVFDFRETPLTDAVDFIRMLHKINIRFDERALSDAGILTDTPVTLSVENIPLQSALKTLLDQIRLTSVLRDEVLQITTPDVAATVQSTRTYDVSDLIKSGKGGAETPEYDARPLIDVLQAAVAPTTWDAVGGTGSMSHFDGVLVVTQSDEGQQQVSDLLRAVREARTADYSKGQVRIWTQAEGEKSTAIHNALQQQATMEFDATPLNDLAQFIAQKHHLPVVVDFRHLTDAGVANDVPITAHLENIRLENALKLALQTVSLTYSVHDDMLHITTPEVASSERITAVYGVRDLIDSEMRSSGQDAIEASEALISVILSTVAPMSWDDAGGMGSIDALPEFGELVVSQTTEEHRALAALLAQLQQKLADRKPTAKSDTARQERFKLVIYTITPPPQPAAGEAKPAEQPKAADLEKLVPELVARESWKDPQVLIRASGDKLFIRQTAAVHREIAKFLGMPFSMTTSSDLGGVSGGGFFSVPRE